MFMEILGEVAMIVALVGGPVAIMAWLQNRQQRKEERRQAAEHRAYVADMFRQIG